MGLIIIDQNPLQVGDEQGSRARLQIAVGNWRYFHRNIGETDTLMSLSRGVQQRLDEMRVRLPSAESTGHHVFLRHDSRHGVAARVPSKNVGIWAGPRGRCPGPESE